MKPTNDDSVAVVNARDSLSRFFGGMQGRDVIFIKLFTNGLIVKNSPLPSILGVAAAKYQLLPRRRIEFVDYYQRFYFPRESYNARAIAANGLDQAILTSKREGSNYPEHFDEDAGSLREYCHDTHLFVGHNIDSFEAEFLPWLHDLWKRTFDTMQENVDILRLEQENGPYGCGWKWPNIRELSDHYSVSIPK